MGVIESYKYNFYLKMNFILIMKFNYNIIIEIVFKFGFDFVLNIVNGLMKLILVFLYFVMFEIF